MGSAFSDLQGSAGYKDKSRRAGRKNGKPPGGLSVVDSSGVALEDLPVSVPDVENKIDSWIAAWCDRFAVSDIRKASAQVFRALCMDIGRNYIKPSGILKDNSRTAAGACVASTCGKYNPAAVVALYDVFGVFCSRCDKIPFGSDFACFSGVSLSYIREYTQGLTASGLDIAKRTHDAEIDAIRRRTSYFPVGGLAILNNELYGGGMIGGGSASVTVDSIPTAGGFKAIDVKPID